MNAAGFHRQYVPETSWDHVADERVRALLNDCTLRQVGRYIVSPSMSADEAKFFGAPLACLAVVDDFGNLRRVS